MHATSLLFIDAPLRDDLKQNERPILDVSSSVQLLKNTLLLAQCLKALK